MSKVLFHHIYKRYAGEKRAAVNDFHLEVEDGEFLVLVGPSGCGKSTLLRMLAGLEDITEGNIYIGDRIVNYISSKDRNIAMVFQNYALYPHMTVYENIAFGLRLRKLPKAEIHERVSRAAKILEIESQLPKLPKQMSGGQRQRVALGRAIVREPEVFLMDEPLSNLDAKLRVQMREEIGKLYRRLRTTTVYVTHDQVEALTMGTRIVVMKDGIIQQVAKPEEIYKRPANLFVAGFIGSPPMNFVEGKLRLREGQCLFETRKHTLLIPEEKSTILRDNGCIGKTVILGIRAENLLYRDEDLARPELLPNQFEAVVEIKELLGSDTYLYTNNKEQRIVVRVDPHTAFEEGQSIRVAIDMQRAHFFDKVSEVLLC
ncbi:ABC transporter ATP-binding protein [Paenibacillus eucommiae]|uniref:Multiple sugar transport system ATP-binding protein n=1 Tax=Paenibacillus eucommiae TaxID=1355755 RepID=A0ABS4IV38_9BACL|nr:sn-glycerol-3-phosphate ABC transporter ATP-binding protein UgpC [Paenibacillus eucommiae]MBP1990701.1 multiple sugar transport system ATP-binding protein [Paenibacillus eucommiae]